MAFAVESPDAVALRSLRCAARRFIGTELLTHSPDKLKEAEMELAGAAVHYADTIRSPEEDSDG